MESNPDMRSDDDRVRDHLANERTYLAWVRTGVSNIALGVVIAKLRFLLGPSYQPSSGVIHAADIGMVFCVVGLITIAMSIWFFISTQTAIRNNSYRSRKRFVVLLSIMMLFLGAIVFWYLLQPSAKQ